MCVGGGWQECLGMHVPHRGEGCKCFDGGDAHPSLRMRTADSKASWCKGVGRSYRCFPEALREPWDGGGRRLPLPSAPSPIRPALLCTAWAWPAAGARPQITGKVLDGERAGRAPGRSESSSLGAPGPGWGAAAVFVEGIKTVPPCGPPAPASVTLTSSSSSSSAGWVPALRVPAGMGLGAGVTPPHTERRKP